MRAMKHPWNDDPMNGHIDEIAGYVCINPLDSVRRDAIFFSFRHGMCEMYMERKDG